MKKSMRNKNVRKSKFSMNVFETKKETRKKEINVTKYAFPNVEMLISLKVR